MSDKLTSLSVTGDKLRYRYMTQIVLNFKESRSGHGPIYRYQSEPN